jgi:biotin operon repressor
MSIEEPHVERQEALPQRRQRLKLIDIYTYRGAFSSDELQGIAAKARDLTRSTRLANTTEEQLPQGESSGEQCGEAFGRSSGEPQGQKETHFNENTEAQSNDIGSLPTTPFTVPSSDIPYTSPYSTPHTPPDRLPNNTPKGSPYYSPNTPPDSSPTIPLTENQAILYFCLKQLNGVITNLSRISQVTGISEHTLKSCLKKLRQEGLIQHSGRQQFKGLTGFSAITLPKNISLQGDGLRFSSRLQRIDYKALALTARLTPLNPDAPPIDTNNPTAHPNIPLTVHPTIHPTVHRAIHLTDHPNDNSPCSSRDVLLQGLVLEEAFQDLDPRSLLPYLDQFKTSEEFQNFLDVANACISAGKEGRGRPIQNPHGFLFAQLRVGYINPPEGFKSRRIRAQEMRNKQLEEELATLQKLKEREQELRFELFVAQLTAEDLERLEREARAEVKPHIGLSPAFQLTMQKDTILKQWFAQRSQPQQEDSGSP